MADKNSVADWSTNPDDNDNIAGIPLGENQMRVRDVNNAFRNGMAQIKAAGFGIGDVVGPASAINSRIAAFDGITGKLLKDGGKLLSDLATAAQGAKADAFAGRNKLINPNFAVNQRAKSGTVTLAAGVYGHDRWKAGASGCTYTFATSANVTTITISAGSLQQVIEGANLYSGTHVLSWGGTAQGKIGAGSYGASGLTATVTGGTNLTVEFNTGTLSQPQFEVGAAASPFEQRSIQQELALCQRYARYFGAGGVGGTRNNSIQNLSFLYGGGEMRAIPAITLTANATLIVTGVAALTGTSIYGVNNPSLSGANIDFNTSVASANNAQAVTWGSTNLLFADAEL